MGYTTDFDGSLKIKRPLSQKKRDYINLLGNTRRMKRDVNVLMELYKGKHGHPDSKPTDSPEVIYGVQGEFFAMEDNNFGQNGDKSVLDNNSPASTQPGLWCQWMITEDGKYLEWDGGEKFYNYIEWLEYLIKTFFIPWGNRLDGEIRWYGEDRDDVGKIKVRNNEVFVLEGQITYEDEFGG